MSPSLTFSRTPLGGRSVFAKIIAASSALLILLAVVAGCGGGKKEETKDKEVVVLATVGGTDITSDYYEDRLSVMEKNELPRGEDRQYLDMSLMEGKEEFLTTLINKEIMVQTAEKLGMDNDPNVINMKKTLTEYEAHQALIAKAFVDPAKTISEEELQAFYAKMSSTRNCSYLITNTLPQAEKARQEALEGADWNELVNKYHDGEMHPTGVNEISVPYGRYNAEFENGVFDTEIGGITPAIQSSYGYWVLKVLDEMPGDKPSLEDSKAKILDITYARKKAKLQNDFVKQVFDKFELTIHEDALLVCYEALPKSETLFREGTQEPLTQDELEPLDIPTADLDMPLYSYINREGETKEYTLLDYKIVFDKMGVFQRPKYSEMVGGLRNKLQSDLSKIVMNFEGQDRGYFEDPEVVAKVNIRAEEMMVNQLYNESVAIEETITAEELDAFWAEHSEEYIAPESRSGRMVVCLNAEQAAQARAQAEEGMSWKDLLVAFGIDRDNKSRSGKLVDVVWQADEPVSEALFALEPDQLSEPFLLAGDRYGVVRLDSVSPERALEMIEVHDQVTGRMREIRREAIFQAKLAEWKEDITVVTFPENLAVVASWDELTAGPELENVIPRN